MKRVTLDTNAIIYFLKSEPGVVERIRQFRLDRLPLYVSAITELEVLSHASLTAAQIVDINEFLRTLAVMPVDSSIARSAADLRRKYRLRTPDSAIAATAMAVGSTLATRDIGHFEKIKELSLERI